MWEQEIAPMRMNEILHLWWIKWLLVQIKTKREREWHEKRVGVYRVSLEFSSLTASGEEAVFEPGGLALNAPQPPAWGEGLKQSVCGMDGVLRDVEGPPPPSWCVEVRGGGKAAPHSPLCSLCHPLQSRPLSSSAAAVPHGDAGAEDALYSTVVEAPQNWAPKSSSPQLPEEVEMLVGLPDQAGSVGTPGEVIGYMHTQVPEAGDHFHSCSSDVQGRERTLVPSEVHHHLLGLLHIDGNGCFLCTTAPGVPPPLYIWTHHCSTFVRLLLSSANFTIWQLGCLAEQSYTQHWWWRRRQCCGSWQSGVCWSGSPGPSSPVWDSPREESFCTRVCGMMVLKAEEKSMKSRRT